MRFYLLTIQHNYEKDAENRTAPKGYDKLDDAIRDFHTQVGKDMGNDTLDWSLNMVINSEGGIHKSEKWSREVVPTVAEVEEVAEVTPVEIPATEEE